MTTQPRSFAGPSRIVLGAGAAVLTLSTCYLFLLVLRGEEFFEWGIGFSYALGCAVVIPAYALGTVLIYASWRILNRLGQFTSPNLVIFGILLVILLLIFTEVDPIAQVFWPLPWLGTLGIVVTLSSAVTLALGYRGRSRKRGQPT